MDQVNGRHILFVVGMHRAGTSALCAALSACGARFGTRLLEPMAGVNDEGFWEVPEVVEVNDELLQLAASTWFSVDTQALGMDWEAGVPPQLRSRALELIENGLCAQAVTVIKDPRLCLTLPFWLSLCRELSLAATVCLIWRSPIEIAHSLQKRDALPPGFGLRLFAIYYSAALAAAGPDALRVTYQALLDAPVATMERLAADLPLQLDRDALCAALNPELRHHAGDEDAGRSVLHSPAEVDVEECVREIEASYPVARTMNELAGQLVGRGRELTRIGEAHALALDIVTERDEQIADFDRRLQDLGQLHARALSTLDQRDEQLACVQARLEELETVIVRARALPVAGWLFRMIWRYAAR